MRRLSKFIKGLDSLGYKISIKFKGRDTFKSVFGGIMTIMARLALLAYFLVQLVTVFQRS